jgi:CheY-like chemotaxis protein
MNRMNSRTSLKITAAERPNTLGIGQRDLDLLLSKLEATEEKDKAPIRREFSRWPFRHATISVTLTQPTGGEVHLKLACRNLSRGGISLLHNQFVHSGSSCVVSLPRLAGGVKAITGTVKRCVHKRLTLHEVGIKFDSNVELREFLGVGRGSEFYSLEHVDGEKLAGQALVVEDSDIDYRVLQHFLRETNLAMLRAKSVTEALTFCDRCHDIIISDWRLPDMSGTEFVVKLREMGIETPVLIITADPVALMRSGVFDSTNTGMLSKPLNQALLLRAIAERLLIQSETDSATGRSAHIDRSAGIRLAEAYVEQFHKLADDLEQRATCGDVKALAEICIQIRGSAPACGAPHLARIADQAAQALSLEGSQPQGFRLARDLAQACRRLQAA